MPCDTARKPNQTMDQRKVEVREAISRLASLLATGRAKVVISKTGAVAFAGTDELASARVTDACAFRLILSSGSALAKAAIAKAEALAGRGANRHAATHSHDGGATWHHGH